MAIYRANRDGVGVGVMSQRTLADALGIATACATVIFIEINKYCILDVPVFLVQPSTLGRNYRG